MTIDSNKGLYGQFIILNDPIVFQHCWHCNNEDIVIELATIFHSNFPSESRYRLCCECVEKYINFKHISRMRCVIQHVIN